MTIMSADSKNEAASVWHLAAAKRYLLGQEYTTADVEPEEEWIGSNLVAVLYRRATSL